MKYLKVIIILYCFTFLRLLEADNAQTAFNEGIAQAEHYVTVKGDQLRYAFFKTPFETRGTVVFVQGRATFLEFYEVAIVPLLERGFDVWMYDLSGQGKSSRLVSGDHHSPETIQHMQHVNEFDHYIDDLSSFVEEIVVPNTSGKLILGGYSTGGHIALRYLAAKNQSHPFKAAFMISPLLALKVPHSHLLPYLLWSASWFIDLESYISGAGHVDPLFKMPFKDNPYTSDEEGYAQLKELCILNRPLVMGGVSYGWVKAAANSLSTLWSTNAIQSIQIPVLITTGGKDGVVDVSQNEHFVKRLPSGNHLYFEEGRHELFRERAEIKNRMWVELDEFLQETRLGSGADQ